MEGLSVSHVVILLVVAIRSSVFRVINLLSTLAVRILTHKIKKILVIGIGLYLCNLVVDAIQWIYVLLDGVLGGAPHLVDDADDHDEDHGHEQEEDTRQDGKPDIHIEQGVVLLT